MDDAELEGHQQSPFVRFLHALIDIEDAHGRGDEAACARICDAAEARDWYALRARSCAEGPSVRTGATVTPD